MAQKHKILIIDDDPNISDVYSMEFNAHGYDVGVAFDAVQAMEKLKGGFVPDVILLDIIMPGSNGIELLEKLIHMDELAKTKIIIFSNLDQKGDLDDEMRAKIAGYYLKVDMIPSKILATVEGLLGSSK